ncbi:MAG: hypothetical protein WCB68_17760 [Pyrinomonadaceae bacterium]
MLITSLGGVGFGLVWGWLMGSLEGHTERPLRRGLIVGAATLLISAEIFWLANGFTIALFLGAALIALLLHVGWRRNLRERYGHSA